MSAKVRAWRNVIQSNARTLKVLAAAVLLAATACGGDSGTTPPPPPPPPTMGPPVSLTLSPGTLTFDWVGQRVTLAVTARDANGVQVEPPTLTFSSADPTIVTVDQSGTAQGVALGSTTLTVTGGNLSATAQAIVTFTPLVGSSGTVAFVGATVLPMDGSGPLADHTVLVRDGWIAEVGARASVTVPPTATVVDGGGRFLMPGLVDAHTHPIFNEDLIPYVANGVTTILTMGMRSTRFEQDQLTMRSAVEGGQIIGPTMFVAGFVDGPGGVAEASRTARDAPGAANVIERIAQSGADFVKVYNSVPASALPTIVSEAAVRDMSVAGHGVRATGMEGMLRIGVRMVAHAEEYIYTHFHFTTDAGLIPSAVQITREANAWVTPNLSTFNIIAQQWGNPPMLAQLQAAPEWRFLQPTWQNEWLNNNPYVGQSQTPIMQNRLDLLRNLTKALSDGDVPLILGTDSPGIAGMFPGFSIHDDLRLLVAAGLTPTQALIAGTRTPGELIASFFVGSQPVGLVRPNMRADLILLNGDPTLDVGNVKDRVGVMVRGRWLTEADLRALLETVAQ